MSRLGILGIPVLVVEGTLCVGLAAKRTVDDGQNRLNDGRARRLGTTLADDVETLGGTGESYIEQVEVVDDILQMLMAVVGFVDGARHTLLAVIDGYEGQVTERRLRRTAPQHVTALLLQLPVAEGADDVVELQTLGLVNADEADAAELVALYGFSTEVLVPFMQKAVNVGAVVGGVVGQLVIEGTDVGMERFFEKVSIN